MISSLDVKSVHISLNLIELKVLKNHNTDTMPISPYGNIEIK
ncbi:hypothetical protein JCM19274_2207 [Algibacter lectus]|uniref:Uncharacterized protein n=1 Tax=Algibacter lectus TaxID=221126 RepID=A0A090WXS0_9FLAO|nr:hypothetical protein JCM19274_2207 [Algibacter lectus]